MAELKWQPNEYSNFKRMFERANATVYDGSNVTIGADNVTKKRTSSGTFTQELLKRPYFDLWMEVDGDTIIDLGRCRHDIDADALYDKTLAKARAWLQTRLDILYGQELQPGRSYEIQS